MYLVGGFNVEKWKLLLQKKFIFWKQRDSSQSVGIYRTITVTYWLYNVDSGPDCPGRSVLPPLRAPRTPKKSFWLRKFQWPQARCQQKQQTYLPDWPLPLGRHFQFMSIQNQNQYLQDNVFNMTLSFQRNCQRLSLPKLLHLDWLGLQSFPPSPPISAISSQSPCPPRWCSQWPTKQVPLPGTSLPSPQCLSKFHPLYRPPWSFLLYGGSASVCLSIQPIKSSPSLTMWVRAIGHLILLLGC